MTPTQKLLTKKAHLAALGVALSAGLGTVRCIAEPVDHSGDKQKIEQELKTFEDPTILSRRVWLETEWNKYKDGHHVVEETVGGQFAWNISSNQDWAVRLKAPYKWYIAGNNPGDEDKQGLGDLKVATGTAFRLGESWRTGGGLELRTPTATGGVGDNVWRIQEFWSVAWDAKSWLTLSPSAEYNQSLAELHGAAPDHYLEMYFPAIFLLPHYWSVSPRYEAKVDFENQNYVTHSARLQVAKELESVPMAVSLSVKRSFDSGYKEFQVNFVMTYFFR